jgi:hypothetical protein
MHRRPTIGASIVLGTICARVLLPAQVGWPATSIKSLMATGTPCRRSFWARRNHRVRLFLRPAADAQPARSCPHAGRLQRRSGGGCRSWHGVARSRHANRRFGEPTCSLLRHCGVQTELARLVCVRRAPARALVRYGRRIRLSGERCCRGGAHTDAALFCAAPSHRPRRCGSVHRRPDIRSRVPRSPRRYGPPPTRLRDPASGSRALHRRCRWRTSPATIKS